MAVTPVIKSAVGELRKLLQADGADLHLLSVDDVAGTIALALEVEDAECAECVLPPGQLDQVLADGLVRRGVTGHRLVLHDPRREVAAGTTAGPVLVLDPTAELATGAGDPGPDAGALNGKTVVMRIDVLWECWDAAADEWKSMLEAAGATVHEFRRVQGLPGEDGENADKEYSDLLLSADAAIVGLGNCGSCTSWTIRDAIMAAERNVPTVAIVTQQFAQLGTMLSGHYGRPGLRKYALPFPLQTRPEPEVREIAREHFPAMLGALGATV
ncbi:MAG: hypothetical protein AB7L13_15640 [Acidimicrobiia bacterium]